MNRDELLDELTQDILAYVMHGSFSDRHVVSEIAPDALDERFHDYERLVRLHFILRPAVVDFVESLPEQLRRIKTQTQNTSRRTRGSVDGRINWGKTLQARHSRNPDDRSLFVCEHRTESYDIDENLVLKRLLSIIYTTLDEAEPYLRRDYEWITDRWRESTDLIERMRELFERNVHVRRIRSPASYEPTPRMLQRAADSRSELYRTAARLLGDYERSIDGDEAAIRSLLETTAITPDDDETLFELYVLFRYVSAIEELSDDRFEMRTIESATQEVARLSQDGTEVVLYHNSSGRDRGLKFLSDISEKDREDLSRTELIQHESRRVANTYFLDDEFSDATGRPDVIVLEISADDRREYLITEVKNSTRPETIRGGIKETLEYLAFLQQDERFVYDDPAFGTGWNGVLVVQDLEDTATASLDEQRSIRILQASELEERLSTVVERVL
ncbi:hypothetical protein [Halapricum desulfuricans]|uniref:Restriction endonuclease n=1 Tax=Halapricum desulfuricans TaxID=2841257 RepID=A0A897NAN3_9EURY|nr:hypothetical protein [Halapricum desulfuricans]QSG08153.1 Uncharacterized protein HSR122_0748 [Halapricum desulfuricans]